MRNIKNYEDFISEEINWKKAITGAAIVASLNLTSCLNKKDFDSKIPQVENLVEKHLKNSDKEFIEVITIKGPFSQKNIYNQNGKLISNPIKKFYIVSVVKNSNGFEKYLLSIHIEIENCDKWNKERLNKNDMSVLMYDLEFDSLENLENLISKNERNQFFVAVDDEVSLFLPNAFGDSRNYILTSKGEVFSKDFWDRNSSRTFSMGIAKPIDNELNSIEDGLKNSDLKPWMTKEYFTGFLIIIQINLHTGLITQAEYDKLFEKINSLRNEMMKLKSEKF